MPPRARHRGSPRRAAAAWATAIDVAISVFPPRRLLSGVPSRSTSMRSRASWSLASRPRRAGSISPPTAATACDTPRPPNSVPPSRNSLASPLPVEAPAGAMARPMAPPESSTSTSIVGCPLESQTCRPRVSAIDAAFMSQAPGSTSAVRIPAHRPAQPEVFWQLCAPGSSGTFPSDTRPGDFPSTRARSSPGNRCAARASNSGRGSQVTSAR